MSTSDFRNSARRSDAIVEGSADAIISVSLDGTIASWNSAAERIFGYTSAEAIGRSIRLIAPPAQQYDEDDALVRIGRGETVGRFETVRQGKDGISILISLTVSPIRDDRGVLVGTSRIARDSSDCRRAEAEVAAGQAGLGERLRALVAASGSLLVSPRVESVLSAMLDLARTLMPADGYATWPLQAVGWKVEAFRGVSEEFARRMVSGRGSAPVLVVPFSEVLLAGEVQGMPLLEGRRDAYRDEGIVSLLAIPLTIGAEASATLVCYYREKHDFTEVERQTAAAFGNMASAALTTAALYDDQRRRHEQSSFLAEASAVLGTSVDYHDTLKRVASLAVPHIADWCAIDLVDDSGTLERLAVSHVDPEKRELTRQVGRRSSEDTGSPFSVRTVMRTGKSSLLSDVSAGAIVPRAGEHGDQESAVRVRELGLISYMCVPLLARHRRPLGALSFGATESGRRFREADLQFAENLAERVALAVDNARAYGEARRANQLKDEFLATLSHELRTPLNAIVGYARMLEAGVLVPDRQATALKILNRNAKALTQIVEDVLDVSRIVSGKVRLDVQPVDLSSLLTEAVATTRLAADAKGIAVAATIDPRAGLISGDPDRLRQVLWNLLSNAVKFTRRGGRIHAHLERVHSHVEVVVSDTGVGLSAAFLPHVFERFRQADSRFSREHGGLGLGLAISRHLVEMHGGTIVAESEGEGRGSTFRVRIPVMLGVRPSDVERILAPRVDEQTAAGPSNRRLDGLRVVAVDDEEDALTLLRDILQAAGASVTTVRSPVAAPAIVEVARPDVLITDIGMKEMDGFKLLEEVRRSSVPDVSRVPAVALTAYARSEDRVMALRVGFQMHLAKPIDPDELIAAVRTLARPASSG